MHDGIGRVTLWEVLEKQALGLGFSSVGVAPVTPLEADRERYAYWLEQGYAGSMEYMENTQRVREDPRLFLPRARSVVVAAVNYYQSQDSPKLSGKVARYASGRDYHKVIKKMLRQLMRFLQTDLFPESTTQDYRLSLDAHPVLERAWARRAGLGFIGKNSCLITEKAGSWVLIGCIVTTQKVLPKPKKKGLDFAKLSCGNCTRCISICPTGAIVRPGVIDARKCISYLTIENKGAIPVELREKMGTHLFGCDLCQEVCPFNQRRQTEAFNPFKDKPIAGTAILVRDILKIRTEAEFLERFAGSPLMRAKRLGMLRNACVVAGNLKDKELLPDLQSVLEREPDEMVKEHARWAMDKIMHHHEPSRSGGLSLIQPLQAGS